MRPARSSPISESTPSQHGETGIQHREIKAVEALVLAGSGVGDSAQQNLTAPPQERDGLKRRATRLLKAADPYSGVAFGAGTEDYPCSRR